MPQRSRGEVPGDVRQNTLLWVGCIAGALQDYQYVAKLANAGCRKMPGP
jgi:arsenite methyltransferase